VEHGANAILATVDRRVYRTTAALAEEPSFFAWAVRYYDAVPGLPILIGHDEWEASLNSQDKHAADH